MDSSKKGSSKQNSFSLFNLPQEILESLKIYSEQIDVNTDSLQSITHQRLSSGSEDASDFESSEDSSPSESRKTVRCNKCKLTFKDYKELRTHYHSELHKKNVLKAINNEEISDEEFSSKLSLEDSQYSDSDGSSLDFEEENINKNQGNEKGQAAYLTKDQPFVALEMNFSKLLLIYKSVLYFQQTRGEISISEKEIMNRIHALQKNNWEGKPFYWTIILLSSGHFAGGVMDCATGRMVVKKTFHRYTTRRKQGGSQASNDNAKGKAKSAGANLRRYNEQMIEQEVKEVMTEWKDYIKVSDLVLIHTSNTNKKLIINSTDALTIDDPRIRTIPFTTGRPTLNELSTIFDKLSTTYIKDISEVKLHTVEDEDKETAITPQQKPKGKNTTAANKKNNKKSGTTGKGSGNKSDMDVDEGMADIDETKEEELSKLKYLCKKGLVDMFQKQFENSSLVHLNEPFYNDEEGITLLHLASAYGQSEMVDFLLEAGADPTIKLKEGDKFTGKVNLNTHIKSESSVLKRFNMLMNMTAYDMASDKETRNAFRRYYYRHQDQWNYQEAHITSFLSPEMEEEATRKKQKKKNDKKRRMQSQKKKQANKASSKEASSAENSTVEEEPVNKKPSGSKSILRKLGQSTLNAFGMSAEMRQRLDREKRAQAAMNRLKASSVAGGVTSSTAALFVKQEEEKEGKGATSNNGPSCFVCHKPFGPGQVPFDVMDKKFCSTNCVRVFRLSSNN